MRKLLLLVGGIVFVDTMFFVALTPLLPDYAEDLGLSKAGAGVLSASYALGALAGGIPGGLAVARYGARPTAIFGLGIVAVTTFVFALGDSIVVLDVARFTQGVGSAFAWTAGLTWLISETPAARRGQMIGSAMAAAIVGALFGPVLGGIASVVGEVAAFGAAGLLAVALMAWAAVTPAPPRERPQPIGLLFTAMRSRRVQVGIWFVVLPGMFFGSLAVLAPLRLEDLGFSAVAIGTLWLFTAGLEAIANPVVAEALGPHRPLHADALVRARRRHRRAPAPLAERGLCPRGARRFRRASPSAASGRRRWRCSPTRPSIAGSSTPTSSR